MDGNLNPLARFALFCCLALASCFSLSETIFHPWLEPPPKLDAQAYITNLKSGDKVVSPFVVKFGMRNWGIAPTAVPTDIPRTGHFHLLIDTPLPSPIDAPIPFSKNYIHFGKGQMEAILDLPPGPHNLRLLLANRKHVPYFVFSDLVKVTVTGREPNALPVNYGKVPRLEFLNIKDGDSLIPPFLLQFHASGLNISPAESKLRGTGYFQLKLESISARRNVDTTIPFPRATTEASLNPPSGSYHIQLQFIENESGKPANTASEPIVINVRSK